MTHLESCKVKDVNVLVGFVHLLSLHVVALLYLKRLHDHTARVHQKFVILEVTQYVCRLDGFYPLDKHQVVMFVSTVDNAPPTSG